MPETQKVEIIVVLDPSWITSWQDYQSSTNVDASFARQEFQRRMFRRRRNHIFPPPIFEADLIADVADLSTSLVCILKDAPFRVFGDDRAAWLDFIGVSGPEAELLASCFTDRHLEMATTFARPDFIISQSGLQLVEINVATPMGGMTTALPYFERFKQTGYYEYLVGRGARPAAPDLVRHWVRAVRKLTRRSNNIVAPVLFEAAASPTDIAPGRQHFTDLARLAGFSVASGYMSDITVRNTGVYVDGARVDCVFTMFTWDELRHSVPFDLIRDLISADELGQVDFICPPSCALFDSKTNLELLTSPKHQDLFSADERAIINRCIPTTLRLTKSSFSEAIDTKNKYVLKPASAYGGQGVIIGPEVSNDQWKSSLDAALLSGPHVLQELVDDHWLYEVLDYPEPTTHRMSIGGIVFDRQYAGSFVRQVHDAGVTPIINAKQGAQVGTAIVDYNKAPASLRPNLIM